MKFAPTSSLEFYVPSSALLRCTESLATFKDPRPPVNCRSSKEGPDDFVHDHSTFNGNASSCTFRFLPGQENVIEGRRVESSVAIADLEPMGFKTIEAQNFDISFLNSNGDAFRLWTEAGRVHFAGQKR